MPGDEKEDDSEKDDELCSNGFPIDKCDTCSGCGKDNEWPDDND
jgi:hypothetical protein